MAGVAGRARCCQPGVSVRGWLLVVPKVGDRRAEHPRGNREGGVDERAIWTWRSRSAFRLTIGRAARIRSASAKKSPAELGGCRVLWNGPDVVPVEAPPWWFPYGAGVASAERSIRLLKQDRVAPVFFPWNRRGWHKAQGGRPHKPGRVSESYPPHHQCRRYDCVRSFGWCLTHLGLSKRVARQPLPDRDARGPINDLHRRSCWSERFKDEYRARHTSAATAWMTSRTTCNRLSDSTSR